MRQVFVAMELTVDCAMLPPAAPSGQFVVRERRSFALFANEFLFMF
jgi:hypothetical protein